VTEIPEHLLKRSRERRAALGEGGGESPAETPAATSEAPRGVPAAATPAPTAPAATPAPQAAAAPPPPPKPPPPYIAAAEGRPKVPFWALPVVAALPLWLFIYMLGMRPVVHEPTGPLADGVEAYSNCSSCHGGGGEGGVGYQLSNGEVNKSFDTSQEMHEWIAVGTEGFAGQPYGNGRHVAGERGTMPAWESQLTAAQIIGVACHEFYVLGGADPEAEQYAEDYALWCAPEAPGFIAAEESGEMPDPADLEVPEAAG